MFLGYRLDAAQVPSEKQLESLEQLNEQVSRAIIAGQLKTANIARTPGFDAHEPLSKESVDWENTTVSAGAMLEWGWQRRLFPPLIAPRVDGVQAQLASIFPAILGQSAFEESLLSQALTAFAVIFDDSAKGTWPKSNEALAEILRETLPGTLTAPQLEAIATVIKPRGMRQAGRKPGAS